jgi:hypothetical protein
MSDPTARERLEEWQMFSKPDELTLTITPLGAAVVEAMPDRKKVARINRRFKHNRECPTSEIFPLIVDVLSFYQAQGVHDITAVQA